MEQKIENNKKRMMLGITGSVVTCMLLDNKEQIKSKNKKLTDEEIDTVYEILQKEIEQQRELTKNKDMEYKKMDEL